MIVLLLLILLLPVAAWWLIANPVLLRSEPTEAPDAQADRLEADVRWLTENTPGRAAHDTAALDTAAAWIGDSFRAAGCEPVEQEYRVGDSTYRNVICSLGPRDGPRVVMGGHYDVIERPGADDNASAVAALLELARLVGKAKPRLPHRLDLVAFTLEEPPHFQTATMGSNVYARRLAQDGATVKLAVSVEMIGYFSDATGSQKFPFGPLGWIYPNQGDFIAVAGRLFDRSPVARVKDLMSLRNGIPVYSINAPVELAGIDFSDHWSFWQNGQPAVMVTDTAFYRNPNYHTKRDTPNTLDYRRMALVVDGLYQVAVGY